GSSSRYIRIDRASGRESEQRRRRKVSFYPCQFVERSRPGIGDGDRILRTKQMAKVSHMVLPVSDVHKSRDWYVDKLGFKVEREHEGVVGIKDESGLTIFLQKTAGNLAGQKITLTI